ncbi:peptidase inhibitor family I36 protein [Lentzea sp. NPDC004782]|uniref:peptidase inhibitor family I36 protein n=1 Tax=Lentzea sp. NPDC004782 TaxID=3154458 RepID=UPI0033A392AF
MKKITMIASALAMAASVAVPVAAQADVSVDPQPRNGICEVGEFCLYYLSNRGGSVSDFNTSIPGYGSSQPTCYEFRGPGAGQGLCVWHNAMSAWNRTSHAVRVHRTINYRGGYDLFAAGQYKNLVATSNLNECHLFL